jgi:hypothetical protein
MDAREYGAAAWGPEHSVTNCSNSVTDATSGEGAVSNRTEVLAGIVPSTEINNRGDER